MKFADEAKIYVKAGNGGHGSVSFRREKYVPMGGPDGGNGGNGGSVYFVAVNNLNTLIDFKYNQHFKAKNGLPGMGACRTGASGENLYIKVPAGTEVLTESGNLIADLEKEGDKFKLLQGGKGGIGNMHFKSSVNRAPRRSTDGEQGEEMIVILKLKLIADVGLVGLPNAGKSTFLSVISAARPKIADYPFTTLKPNLGTVISYDSAFIVADIPGLIEGAHEGIGLGTEFLKHIERCKLILHLIDITSSNLVNDYKTIRNELSNYSKALSDKYEIVALTKCDLMTPEEAEAIRKNFAIEIGRDVYLVSSATNNNVKQLVSVAQLHIAEIA